MFATICKIDLTNNENTGGNSMETLKAITQIFAAVAAVWGLAFLTIV
jgi:hypothetical protein